ncbi:MAG: hypothetical protein M3O22_03595 [Pseudomonadota bacterium]|nr:hypothetical protein [Pseudomonadota bacterium]
MATIDLERRLKKHSNILMNEQDQKQARQADVALMLGENGDLGLAYESGSLAAEPICAVWRPDQGQLSIVLASGDTVSMAEPVREEFTDALQKSRRLLLMEMGGGEVVAGYGVPLICKSAAPALRRDTA